MTIQYVKEFTIDRAKWTTGACWKPFHGRMCALGQYMNACGLDPCITDYEALPRGIRNVPRINDGRSDDLQGALTPWRERAIVAEFAKAGITATFVGEYR
jgi:hypothetical protein